MNNPIYNGKPYGNVIVNGQISFNGTAAMAKFRLKTILIVDRIRCKDERAIKGMRRFEAVFPPVPNP